MTGGGGPTASVGNPVTVGNATSTAFVTAAPVAAPQPAGAPPLTSGPKVQVVGGTGAELDALSSNFTGTIVQVGGESVGRPNCLQRHDEYRRDPMVRDRCHAHRCELRKDHSARRDRRSEWQPVLLLSVDLRRYGRQCGHWFLGFQPGAAHLELCRLRNDDRRRHDVHKPDFAQAGHRHLRGLFRGQRRLGEHFGVVGHLRHNWLERFRDDHCPTRHAGAAAAARLSIWDSPGTAIANRDYSISNGANSVVNAVGAPIELLIPAGQTSGSVVLTGLGNTAATSDQTLTVSVTSINGTAPSRDDVDQFDAHRYDLDSSGSRRSAADFGRRI